MAGQKTLAGITAARSERKPDNNQHVWYEFTIAGIRIIPSTDDPTMCRIALVNSSNEKKGVDVDLTRRNAEALRRALERYDWKHPFEIDEP